MIHMNEELLRKIEGALNIKFYEWQRNYLLDIPMLLDMRMTGRCTGKTLVYIIKKLYKTDEPLYLTTREEMVMESDWWCVGRTSSDVTRHGHYDLIFRDLLRDLYEELNDKGLITRKVIFSPPIGNKRRHIGIDYSSQPDKSGFLNSTFNIPIFKIDNAVTCPHCGTTNEKEGNNKQDVSLYGKAVFTCTECGKLFTLANDGDGEYVHIPRSQRPY